MTLSFTPRDFCNDLIEWYTNIEKGIIIGENKKITIKNAYIIINMQFVRRIYEKWHNTIYMHIKNPSNEYPLSQGMIILFGSFSYISFPDIFYFYKKNKTTDKLILKFLQEVNHNSFNEFIDNFYLFITNNIILPSNRSMNPPLTESLRFFMSNIQHLYINTYYWKDVDFTGLHFSNYYPKYYKDFDKTIFNRNLNSVINMVIFWPILKSYSNSARTIIVSNNGNDDTLYIPSYPRKVYSNEKKVLFSIVYIEKKNIPKQYKNNIIYKKYYSINLNFMRKNKLSYEFSIPDILERYEQFKSQNYALLNEDHENSLYSPQYLVTEDFSQKNDLGPIQNDLINFSNLVSELRQTISRYPKLRDYTQNIFYLNSIAKYDRFYLYIYFDNIKNINDKKVQELIDFFLAIFPIMTLEYYKTGLFLDINSGYNRFIQNTEKFDFLIKSYKFTWECFSWSGNNEYSIPSTLFPPSKYFNCDTNIWDFPLINIFDVEMYKNNFRKIIRSEIEEFRRITKTKLDDSSIIDYARYNHPVLNKL